MTGDNRDKPGPKSVKSLLPAELKPPGKSIQRLFEDSAEESDINSPILYQHSVLCQTCLPFRDPGDQVRSVERANGGSHARSAAGSGVGAGCYSPSSKGRMNMRSYLRTQPLSSLMRSASINSLLMPK